MKKFLFKKVELVVVLGLAVFMITACTGGNNAVAEEERATVELPAIPIEEVLKLSDLGDQEKTVKPYYTEEAALARMKNFYAQLSVNPNWTYNEIIVQPTFLNNFNDKRMARKYDGIEIWKIQKEGKEYSEVEAIALNANAIAMSNFEVQEGSLLQEDAFTIGDITEQSIPVLLGSDYQGLYAVGDKIAGWYISCGVTYEVVGILKSGCGVYRQGYFKPVDNYVILPSLNFTNAPETTDELLLQGAFYLAKVNGEVVLHQGFSKEEFAQVLNQLIVENEMLNYDFWQIEYDTAAQ